MSHCSARLRHGWSFSFELWNLRANVVVGRASLCAHSFRSERSQFADCWCFSRVYGCARGSWSLWLSVASGEHVYQWMQSDRLAWESHEWAQASAIVVVSRLQRVVYSMEVKTLWEYLIQVADPQWSAFGACVRRRFACRCWKSTRRWRFLAAVAEYLEIKLTGRIPALKRGVLQFLGRTIYRERDGIYLKSEAEWGIHGRDHRQLAREVETERDTAKAGRDLQRS